MDGFDYDRSNGSRPNGAPHFDEVDAALLALIDLVLDDAWSAQRAATALRVKVTDELVLCRVRTRVQSALAERPTPVAQRAARTLDVLLGDRDPNCLCLESKLTRAGRNQGAAAVETQRSPVAVADEQIGSDGQGGARVRPTVADRLATCLEPLARNLEVLAQQIDDLTKTDQVDAGQFIQLDMAARYALAANHAIDAVDGHAVEQRVAAGPREPELGQIRPEFAESLIQRIFAAGLHLTALQSLLGDHALSDKVAASIGELDIVVRAMRAESLRSGAHVGGANSGVELSDVESPQAGTALPPSTADMSIGGRHGPGFCDP